MNLTSLHKIHALLLVTALAFGQIGAGFLHNKHDAHEAVIDLDSDHPVLVNHGEHCKVCAVDWAHPSDLVFFAFVLPDADYNFSAAVDVSSITDPEAISKNNKAPPFLS